VGLWQPDPTFYPSPRAAISAPREKIAFVALLNGEKNDRHDALGVVDVDPKSASYGKLVGQVDMPNAGDELHHFGWNACSACLSPYAPHPHTERRYLIVPGIHSSRIHIIDTKPNPLKPKIIKVIEPETLATQTGYSNPHTVHCGPAGIFVSALGAPGGDGPGGIFIIDPESSEVLGKWEIERGPQYLAYDFWWHLGYDILITSEWETPKMVEAGISPELLLAGKYGHALHIWDLCRRRHLQTLDLGAEQQMVLELRPAHDPTRAYGFVGVVVSLKDLSASIWLWHRDNGNWAVRKVIEIPAEPADPDQLPPLLKGFKAVPPLVTDINLSLEREDLRRKRSIWAWTLQASAQWASSLGWYGGGISGFDDLVIFDGDCPRGWTHAIADLVGNIGREAGASPCGHVDHVRRPFGGRSRGGGSHARIFSDYWVDGIRCVRKTRFKPAA
jgi:selenium-binding protein 1